MKLNLKMIMDLLVLPYEHVFGNPHSPTLIKAAILIRIWRTKEHKPIRKRPRPSCFPLFHVAVFYTEYLTRLLAFPGDPLVYGVV